MESMASNLRSIETDFLLIHEDENLSSTCNNIVISSPKRM